MACISRNRLASRLIALAAGCTALFFAHVAESQAAFPGTPAKIYFSANRDGDYEIYSVSNDGTNLAQLTDNAFEDCDPTVSADGRRVAFASNRDGNWEIYVMDIATGANLTRVTNNGVADLYPAWYPDGLQLAISRGSNDLSEIYRVKVNGSEEQRLTDDSSGTDQSDAWPTVTPDGSKILWERNIGTGGALDQEIFSMNALDGSGKTNLTNNAYGDYLRPSVYPDGTRFAWTSTRTGQAEVLTANVSDGSNVTVFTDPPSLPSPSLSAFAPVISPDGEITGFGTFYDGGGPSLWTVGWDGGNLLRMTPSGASVVGPSGASFDWGRITTETLSVSSEGTGTGSVELNWIGGSIDPFVSDEFDTGTPVTLSANPGTGSAFTGWSGGSCAGIGDCSLTMDGTKSVTATFDEPAPVVITGKPARSTRSKAATFRFTPGAGAVTSYRCRIDTKPTSTCTSPIRYRRLKKGRHVFRVHSTLSGIDGPTTIYRWRVR